MTAGIPNSRASTAGCEVVPPVSVTSPAIFVNSTTQAGIGHLADEDVAVADLVELVDRSDDPGGAFDDAGRRPEAGDQPLVVRLLLVEAVRVAPVDEIRERELRGRDRADPVARVEALGRLALQPAGGDELAGRDRIGARRSGPAARCSEGT